MQNVKPFTTVLATLLLTGCTSLTTTALKPTETVRNAAIIEKSVDTRFEERQQPSGRSPYLKVAVIRYVTQEESFEQHYVRKRILNPRTRTALWLGGATLAGGGYYLLNGTGWVMLGKDLMWLGLILPLGGEVVTASLSPVGEEWREANRELPLKTVPRSQLPLEITTGFTTWRDTTDVEGVVEIDISNLVDLVAPGQSLEVAVALLEDSTHKMTFSIPGSIVELYRQPPPTIEELGPGAISSVSLENAPTLAVLDFQGIGVSAQEAMVLTNRLGTQMVQIGRYQVIERGQMEQILQEQDFQLTGCISDECAVEIGQLLGAQLMLAGSFGKLGTVYTIDMKIIDVETGRILKTTSYDIEGSINRLLSEGLAEAVRRIVGVD